MPDNILSDEQLVRMLRPDELGSVRLMKCERDGILAHARALRQEIERLKAHIKDLDHDVQAAVDEANWQLRQGDDYGTY